MKKIVLSIMSIALAASLFASCGNGTQGSGTQTGTDENQNAFDTSAQITVVSREASSGTRGAFDELMNIVVKDGDNETDNLFPEAIIVDSTDAVASKVEVDPSAIGYTSLGSVTEHVKAVKVDGVEATVENVLNDSYKIKRPFVLALPKNSQNPIAADFIKFVMSTEGQAIVENTSLIQTAESESAYTAANLSGKLTLSGSTSVEKVMEKLREEYIKLNPGVEIEITYSGSGAGIKDATEGKVDLGMSSRALKDEEKTALDENIFALDAIAVIVNAENPVDALSSEQITNIFTGIIRTWADAAK